MCATYFKVVVCFFIYFKRKHLHIYHNKGAIVHLINELKIKRSINLFIFFKFQCTIKRSQYFNYNRIIEGLFVKNINIIACWDIIHYDNHKKNICMGSNQLRCFYIIGFNYDDNPLLSILLLSPWKKWTFVIVSFN